MLQDILEISRHRDYTFHYISRYNLNVVDSLLLNKLGYIRKTMLHLGIFNVFNEKVFFNTPLTNFSRRVKKKTEQKV